MTYGTIAEVKGMMGRWSLSASSTPTETQATAILDDLSDEIDAVLAGAGFTVPVTTPTTFVNFLGRLNGYGATAAVLKSMFPDVTGPGEQPAFAFWEKRYQWGLSGLQDGSLIPAGTAPTGGVVAPSTYHTRNPDVEEDIGDIAEPPIGVGKVY